MRKKAEESKADQAEGEQHQHSLAENREMARGEEEKVEQSNKLPGGSRLDTTLAVPVPARISEVDMLGITNTQHSRGGGYTEQSGRKDRC